MGIAPSGSMAKRCFGEWLQVNKTNKEPRGSEGCSRCTPRGDRTYKADGTNKTVASPFSSFVMPHTEGHEIYYGM